jgi:hypothetical protein
VPQRWIFALMGFLALLNAYAMRVCLSIAITEMVVQPNSSTAAQGSCPLNIHVSGNSTADSSHKGIYPWSEEEQVRRRSLSPFRSNSGFDVQIMRIVHENTRQSILPGYYLSSDLTPSPSPSFYHAPTIYHFFYIYYVLADWKICRTYDY